MEKIPATVITGFLGAGKTSLIRHMLSTANGKKLALVINEFGDLGVDGEILKGCGIDGCSDDDSKPGKQVRWRWIISSSRPRGWRCPNRW